MKTHSIVFVLAGLFKTACGIYLGGCDKERGTADKPTCLRCRRSKS